MKRFRRRFVSRNKYDSFMNTRNTRPKCVERTRVILQLVEHPIGLLYLELILVLTI